MHASDIFFILIIFGLISQVLCRHHHYQRRAAGYEILKPCAPESVKNCIAPCETFSKRTKRVSFFAHDKFDDVNFVPAVGIEEVVALIIGDEPTDRNGIQEIFQGKNNLGRITMKVDSKYLEFIFNMGEGMTLSKLGITTQKHPSEENRVLKMLFESGYKGVLGLNRQGVDVVSVFQEKSCQIDDDDHQFKMDIGVPYLFQSTVRKIIEDRSTGIKEILGGKAQLGWFLKGKAGDDDEGLFCIQIL